MTTDLFAELEARGIVKQSTSPELGKILKTRPMTVYAGFDPTADSLHVGSLMPLLTLKRFQNAGHKVIAVAGGATGMIGDPSGKGQERSLLSDEQLAKNVAGIKNTMRRFLDFDGPNAAILVDNADWFRPITFIDFLRDVGKHFTVNHMMAKESVRARLEDREHGISYTEFSYMLLQAYDFYVLHKKHGCDLQIGGSEQWGNIVAGIDLIRRLGYEESQSNTQVEHAFGMTHPLITKADGTKFGKTEKGTIWLDPSKTPPYQFFQFLVQTADADVMNYIRYFTFLELEEIEHLEKSVKEAPEQRQAQMSLARHLTRLVHGQEEMDRAVTASQALFNTDITDLDEVTLLSVMADAPKTQKPRSALEGAGLSIVDALVDTGLCSSKGAARKDLQGGGIYLNNARVSDPAAVIGPSNTIAGRFVVLRKGKKTYHLLAFE